MGRRGNGKLRHVRVGMLWVQERVEDGDLNIPKVKGEDNPADLMTKHLGQRVIHKHMEYLGQGSKDGRAGESLRI